MKPDTPTVVPMPEGEEGDDPTVSALSGRAAGFMLYGDPEGTGVASPMPVHGEVLVYSTPERVCEHYWDLVANGKELNLSRDRVCVVVVYYDDYGDISIPPQVRLPKGNNR